VRKRKIIEVKD